MSVANKATSVIYEIAPNAECMFGVPLDDTLGDTVRVMAVAKGTFDEKRLWALTDK